MYYTWLILNAELIRTKKKKRDDTARSGDVEVATRRRAKLVFELVFR